MSIEDAHIAIYSNHVPENPITEEFLLQLLNDLIPDEIIKKEIFIQVFIMHYGLKGTEKLTLTEVSKMHNISRSSARQCVVRTLRQIRQYLDGLP